MAAKSKDCCCVGCDRPPVMVPIPVTVPQNGAPGQDSFSDPSPLPVQQYCLSCMPYQLCLESTCDGNTQRSMFTRKDPCDATHTMSYWSGFLFIGNTFTTAEIQLDIAYGECYAVFVCPGLGVTGDEDYARLLLTWPIQQALSPHCQDCVDEFYPGSVMSWNLPSCSITSSPVSNTSLTPTMPCPQCDTEPCAVEDEFYHDEYLAYPRFQMCAVCNGCKCVATYLCITALMNGQPVDGGMVKICNYQWRCEGGTVIEVDAAEDGTCQLKLVATPIIPGYGNATPVSPVPIVGQCPDIVATFSYKVTNLSNPSDTPTVSINVAAAECGSCSSLTSVPCCDGPVSRNLVATINGSVCSCGDLSINLVETTLTGETAWVGQSADNAFCAGDPTACTVYVGLFCSSGQWFLQVAYSTTGNQSSVTSDYYSGQCSPMDLVFTGIDGHGKGDCKCEPPFFPKCNDFTVTITE